MRFWCIAASLTFASGAWAGKFSPLCREVHLRSQEAIAATANPYREFSNKETDGGITARDSRTEATRRQRIHEQLQSGELPPHFMERMRFVDPNSPPGKEFQAEIAALFKRLFPKHDFSLDPVRFVIVDEAEANAYAIPYSKPPIIAFTRRMLAEAKTLDEIAITLGHEWKHHLLFREFGPHKNSKGEELWSDVDGLRWAHEAGFDVRVALEPGASARIHGTKLTAALVELVGEYNDPHPTAINRERAAEKFIAFIDNEQGNVAKRQPTDIPTRLSVLGTTGTHESYVAGRQRSAGYENLPTANQIKLLSELVSQVPEGSRSARAKDIAEAIKNLKLTTTDAA